jgi:hypothetical protein
MREECVHATSIEPVPAARDVCEACIVEGTRWVHLRQCLACGQTLCCNDSPRRHMTGHWESDRPSGDAQRVAGRGLDVVLPNDAPIRPARDGWETYDPFVEAGTPLRGGLFRGGSAEPAPDYVTDDGFPLGDWATYVRELHDAGDLDPADTEAIGAIPGWRWSAGTG